ncbi:hypothetical protein ACA910_016852 [Epithemia clementina (nom. ined.)]
MKIHPVAVLMVTLAASFSQVEGFASGNHFGSSRYSALQSSLVLRLVPISNFRDQLTFLSDPDSRLCFSETGKFSREDGHEFELCLAEEADLPDVSKFIVESFGVDVVTISQDSTSLERLIMKPAVELVNGYSGLIAFAEVLAGLRQRMELRLQSTMDTSAPNLDGLSREEKIQISSKTSLVLVLARMRNGEHSGIDVIASVELRLEPCDAKIPFSLPWLDLIERHIASQVGLTPKNEHDLMPYLSSLCVDERYRGQKIGRALVRCVEDIATHWSFSRLYLHVDSDNIAAYELYKSERYTDVGRRWNPFWAGSAAKIGYFVKNLDDFAKAAKMER